MTDDPSPASAGTPPACLPPHLRKPRLRRSEASEYLLLAHGLQRAPATLAKLASVGGGPAFQKPGATPLYAITELDRWAVETMGPVLKSTADCGGGDASPAP